MAKPAKQTQALSPYSAADKAAALALTPVSRETEARLDRYVALLLEWQAKTQSCCALDASESVDPAHRRFAATVGPRAIRQDLGRSRQRRRLSRRRAGLRAGGNAGRAWSTWSNAMPKRPPFLREALRITSAPGIVHLADIGDIVDRIAGPVDCVTARALAPLHELIGFAEPLVKRGAKALFLKGQDVEAELTEATKYWNIRTAASFQPHRRTRLDRRTRPDRAAHHFRDSKWQPGMTVIDRGLSRG